MLRLRPWLQRSVPRFAQFHTTPMRCGGPNPRDPRSWSPQMNAEAIKELLGPVLLPAHEHDDDHFLSLEVLQARQLFPAMEQILRPLLRPVFAGPLNVQQYLDKHLNNTGQLITMPLQERAVHRSMLVANLIPSPKTASDEKRLVVCLYSCRGAGKTSFLRAVAGNELQEWTKSGRAIVRCCEKSKENLWNEVLLKRKPCEALCQLVAEHLEEVIGGKVLAQPNPEAAYRHWIDLTAEHFKLDSVASKELRPVIMLDTCEVFANHYYPSLVHVSAKSQGEKLTLLEALCLQVPCPYGIVVCGCNAKMARTDSTLTAAHVTELPPLFPLTVEGYCAAAADSWDSPVDLELLHVLHELAGGIPRVLRLAHASFRVSLGQGAWNAVAKGLKEWNLSAVRKVNPELVHSPMGYSLLLASSTRFPVRRDQKVIMPLGQEAHMTYDQATIKSLAARVSDGAHSLRWVVIPPILFSDDTTDFQMPVPIKPTQLHPFLDPNNLVELRTSALHRGALFEKPFLYAIYARYLLACWASIDPKHTTGRKWVLLTDVLEGALSEEGVRRVSGIEVCLANGVDESPKSGSLTDATKNAVTWTRGVNAIAHHDAYLWCRKAGQSGALALQLRHEGVKPNREIAAQSLQAKRGARLELPLLVVHKEKKTREEGEKKWNTYMPKKGKKVKRDRLRGVVFVDASAMSRTGCSW